MTLVIRNRCISEVDLQTIRGLIESEGSSGRTHLSRRLCRLWDWRQANGAFREIACRELLRRLDKLQLIKLPAAQHAARRPGYQNRIRPEMVDTSPVAESLERVREQFVIEPVVEPGQRRLLGSLLHAHHYLGYRQPTGPALAYLCFWQGRPLACARFGPAAWKVATRDQFIGWSAEQQQRHRPCVVNNDRFLVLPWVRVPQLASFVLAQLCRRLPQDWQELYHHSIALAETFVELGRFEGTCYAAANWLCVGQTCGRGRNDRHTRRAEPLKSVWVRPLRRDFRQQLTLAAA